MKRGSPSFPRIDPEELRRHDDDGRLDRVWQRVERDLSRRAEARIAARVPFGVAAAVSAAVVFGGGVWVGQRRAPRSTAPSVEVASPAPDKSLIEVLAAGTQTSSFPLEGGGRVTLSPGATVEVERVAGSMTLSLVQGEASLDSATRALTIAAGEARINTQAGSVLTVHRNADDVEVKVDEGSVRVSSPEGQGVVSRNERKVLPLHLTVATPVSDAKVRERGLPRNRPTKLRAEPTKQAPAAEWFTHYPADEKGALASLRKLGVNQAIDGARGPAELMAIAELMAHGGEDVASEIRAFDRVVTAFPGDQRASLAANSLARIYEARGDAKRAKEYRDKVQPLAEKATVGSDALICDLIRREPDKTKAALSAKEYLANYPDGECREEFERLVQSSVHPAAPPPSDPPEPH